MMRTVGLLLGAASVSAFTPAAPSKAAVRMDAKSQALPFLEKPAALDGTLAGRSFI